MIAFPLGGVGAGSLQLGGRGQLRYSEILIGEHTLFSCLRLSGQLVDQYLAYVMSLGPLVTEANLGATLRSIYKYNHKRTLVTTTTRSARLR